MTGTSYHFRISGASELGSNNAIETSVQHTYRKTWNGKSSSTEQSEATVTVLNSLKISNMPVEVSGVDFESLAVE